MINVINFFESKEDWRIGFAVIMYYDMILTHEVMKGKDGKLWIKMPVEKTKHKVKRIASWPTRELSDHYQKTSLWQLEERFKISRFK